jgi:hypothetical protein
MDGMEGVGLMAADLTLGDLRVYDQDRGVTIYYWVSDGKSVLGTLHMVNAYIKDGQLMFGACKRRATFRQATKGDDYAITLMPSVMHHAIYEHYPKLMTYLMLKGKSHG